MLAFILVCVIAVIVIGGVVWVAEYQYSYVCGTRKQKIEETKEHIKILEDYIRFYGTRDKNYKNVLSAKIHLEYKLRELESPFWWL